MRFFTAIILSFLFTSFVHAQDVSLDIQKNEKLSKQQIQQKWNAAKFATVAGFATTDRQFAAMVPPNISLQKSWVAHAWRGEKIHTQLLVSTKIAVNALTISVTDLKSNYGDVIKKQNITTGFVQYVMADEFGPGCGYRKPKDFDSSQRPDIINTSLTSIPVTAYATQPVWLSVQVPAHTKPGIYKGMVAVNAGKKYSLQVQLTVTNHVLPAANQWSYDLDLWQHPAAIARVHHVPLWSDAHFTAMKKYYTMLAAAGQKNITASIVNEPWGHQTYDDYPSLIKWTKKKDGSWAYDYSLFDRYISFVMSCGIKGRISCYSMVPWKIAFTYYDEALQKDTVLTDAIGTPAYNEFWGSMLKDFTKHLKEKKWFDITYIAMDERPMSAMQSIIQLLKSIDKDWKIALAGDYHPEIEKDIFNYCIASKWKYPDEVLQQRKMDGKISTWYTCCTEKYPNAFTFSPPAEMVWMGWYTAATGMDGYLRWAYNSWPATPLQDSRFTAWPSGDTYLVYPGPLSSIRFEKMMEGIQDFEKIKILKKEYAQKNQTEKLNTLQAALREFEIKNLAKQTAEDVLVQYRKLLY